MEDIMDEATGMWYPRNPVNEQFKGLLTRTYDSGIQTIGRLEIFLGDKSLFSCYTLELPWKNNERRVSCIPEGTYHLSKYSSAKYKDVYHVDNVKNRSKILIHAGNFYTDIMGCILVGESLTDINNDGHLDVTASKKTLKALKEVTGYSEFNLTISESNS